MNSKKLRKEHKKKNKKESKLENQNINIIIKEHQIQKEKEIMKIKTIIGKNTVKLHKIIIKQDQIKIKIMILNNTNTKNIGQVTINIKNSQEFHVTNKNMQSIVKIRDILNKISQSLHDIIISLNFF
jgi:hypothetical protein